MPRRSPTTRLSDLDPADALAAPWRGQPDNAPVDRQARVLSGRSTNTPLDRRRDLDAFNTIDCPAAQKFGQPQPVERRPVRQPELQDGVIAGEGRSGCTSQVGRSQPIAAHEAVVEPSQARKAGSQRHVSHRQGGVGQQSLGQQQPLGLGIVDRRDTELRIEDPPQMPVGHTELPRDLGQTTHRECAVFNQCRRRLREPGTGIDARIARRELRPTAQAGPKARVLGCGSARIEAAIFATRRAGGADRPAIDTGAGHAHEEAPIETGVPCAKHLPAQGSVGGLWQHS